MKTIVRSVKQKDPTLEDVIQLGPKLLSQSVRSGLNLLRLSKGLFSQMYPKGSCCTDDDCKIPETECPPRCVCEIVWEAAASEKVNCTIRVKNDSKTTRPFLIKTIPFSGSTNLAGVIQFDKNSVTLNSGQSGLVQASFLVPANTAPGSYTSEITITGTYEQCICVTLEVEKEEACYCEVAQGEPQYHIRAHHWYDHFQCTEPCGLEVTRTPTPPPDNKPSPTRPVKGTGAAKGKSMRPKKRKG